MEWKTETKQLHYDTMSIYWWILTGIAVVKCSGLKEEDLKESYYDVQQSSNAILILSSNCFYQCKLIWKSWPSDIIYLSLIIHYTFFGKKYTLYTNFGLVNVCNISLYIMQYWLYIKRYCIHWSAICLSFFFFFFCSYRLDLQNMLHRI